MAGMTLQDLSATMARIDHAMFTTRGEDGALASRPMSTNGDVEYQGDSWFFSYDDTAKIRDIDRDPQVGLGFTGERDPAGGPPLFIHIEGRAELIRDKEQFRRHWTDSLDDWFEDGIDTPGIVLIKVHATRIRYWKGLEHAEIDV
jgi:general stress protein 26